MAWFTVPGMSPLLLMGPEVEFTKTVCYPKDKSTTIWDILPDWSLLYDVGKHSCE